MPLRIIDIKYAKAYLEARSEYSRIKCGKRNGADAGRVQHMNISPVMAVFQLRY
jgi:hypothetical protein